MNFQHFRYVEAIAETGSFSEAAKLLYLTQPNLSSAIKDLEQELGVQLFIRSNTGSRLTDAGMDFLKYTKRILGEVELLEQRYRDSFKKSFTVASHHYDFLAQPLLEIAQQHQSDYHDFHVLEMTTKEILESVASFESDLGILFIDDDNRQILERYIDREELDFTRLGDFPTRVFLSKKHPLAGLKEIRQKDLSPYAQVRFKQAKQGLTFDEDPLEIKKDQQVFYCNDRGTVMNLLVGSTAYASGLGIVTSFVKDQIVLIPLKDSPLHTLGFVTNKNKSFSPIVTDFIAKLRQQLLQTDCSYEPADQ